MNLLPHITSLPAYVPGESVETLAARLGRPASAIIKLDANENPYGTPPAVRRALGALADTHRYPDAEQRHLRAALAAYTGVPAEYLIAGNGSDELLSLLSQVLLQPGDRILACPPTFSMYAFYAHLKNCETISVPRRADFSLDVEGIFSAARTGQPKIIFLDTPGNPTGIITPPSVIAQLLTLPALIVVDEAYVEFSGVESYMPEVLKHDNLVVTRTFSKWAGLAGFRVGYGAFPRWLGDALWQAKSPYNVTIPASTAAIAALSDGDYLRETVARLVADREALAGELRKFPGLTVFPSATNFLLVRVEAGFGKSAAEVCAALKEQGILVRLFENMSCLRITVGRPEEIETFLEALAKV